MLLLITALEVSLGLVLEDLFLEWFVKVTSVGFITSKFEFECTSFLANACPLIFCQDLLIFSLKGVESDIDLLGDGVLIKSHLVEGSRKLCGLCNTNILKIFLGRNTETFSDLHEGIRWNVVFLEGS